MKKRIAGSILLLTFLSIGFFLHAEGEPTIRIVQPYENATLPSVSQSFVFGSVSPATATLAVNGLPIKPYTNGGFLVMIPFREGPFKIEAVATDGVLIATATRNVVVGASVQSYPADHKTIH